jgi:hypothetical protein
MARLVGSAIAWNTSLLMIIVYLRNQTVTNINKKPFGYKFNLGSQLRLRRTKRSKEKRDKEKQPSANLFLKHGGTVFG